MLELDRTVRVDLVLLVGVVDLTVDDRVVVLFEGLTVVDLEVLVVVELLKVRVGRVLLVDLIVELFERTLLFLDNLEVFDNLRVE